MLRCSAQGWEGYARPAWRLPRRAALATAGRRQHPTICNECAQRRFSGRECSAAARLLRIEGGTNQQLGQPKDRAGGSGLCQDIWRRVASTGATTITAERLRRWQRGRGELNND